jgi:hypothetical protein
VIQPPNRRCAQRCTREGSSPSATCESGCNGDLIEVVLVEPADNPSVIMIRWPDAPTITAPAKLNETAAAVIRILANAVTAYTQIKAAKHL